MAEGKQLRWARTGIFRTLLTIIDYLGPPSSSQLPEDPLPSRRGPQLVPSLSLSYDFFFDEQRGFNIAFGVDQGCEAVTFLVGSGSGSGAAFRLRLRLRVKLFGGSGSGGSGSDDRVLT